MCVLETNEGEQNYGIDQGDKAEQYFEITLKNKNHTPRTGFIAKIRKLFDLKFKNQNLRGKCYKINPYFGISSDIKK